MTLQRKVKQQYWQDLLCFQTLFMSMMVSSVSFSVAGAALSGAIKTPLTTLQIWFWLISSIVAVILNIVSILFVDTKTVHYTKHIFSKEYWRIPRFKK